MIDGTKQDKRWLTIPEAASLIETTPRVIHGLIDRNHLTVRRLPGCKPRVLRDDLERIAEDSITPANGANRPS